MTTESIHAIVGRGNQNLSSALDTLPELHVRFATNNTDEYLLFSDNDNNKNKKSVRFKSNTTYELDRQISTIHRKIDQYQAARYGNLEQLKILFQENQFNYKTFFNRIDPETKLTALHYAARFHHYDICQYLIENCEVDVNKAGEDGMTPLHYIARFRVEKDSQVIYIFILFYRFFFLKLI
jgi:ankyrin repeat protein